MRKSRTLQALGTKFKITVVIYFFSTMLAACQSVDEVGVLVPPTVDQDPSLPHVSISVAGKKRRVHVRAYGHAGNPPLFILHGSYSDSRPYRNIAESLSDKYYVILWDQRGCGLSERITEPEFTLESALAEINAMKAIYAPTTKITILGQSWGGGLATFYTARHPTQVEQLILIEPMPLTGRDMMQLFDKIVEWSYFNSTWNNLARQGQALGNKDHEQIDYRAMLILRSTMTGGYHCDPNNPPPWPIHRVGGFLESVRNKRLGDPLAGFTYDFTQGLSNYTAPILILGGSCSSLGYAMQLKFSQPHFANAQVVEISNAGHRMNMEKFSVVMNEIKSFLNQYP